MHPRYPGWILEMSQRPAWANLPADHPDKAPTIHQFRRDRLAATLSDSDQDMANFLEKYGIALDPGDTMERYHHRLRVNLHKVPADVRARSLEWLRLHDGE